MTDIFRAKFIIELEAVGQRFEVAKFTSDFGINDIPTATCVLAIGRNAANGVVEAKIHKHLDSLKEFVGVKVYFRAEGEWNRSYDWPSGEFLIFEGKIQGIGFQKVSGKVELVAHLQHWLMDLNYGSAVNAGMHPSLPDPYTHEAVYDGLLTAGTAGGVGVAGMARTSGGAVITADNVEDDLWGQVLKPLLCSLSQQPGLRLDSTLTSIDCFDISQNVSPSAAVLSALKRIEGVSANSSCSSALSCYTPKLSLMLGNSLSPGVRRAVSDAISEAIMNTAVSSFVRSTIWSKLIEYGEIFHFDIIPLANSAIVVPKTFGLRDTWCKRIAATDYATVALNAKIDKPVRGVAVIGIGTPSATGIFSTTNLSIGGCYTPDPPSEDGMIHIVRPPRWLESVPSSGASAARSTGIASTTRVPTSTTPATSMSPAITGSSSGVTRGMVVASTRAMYEAYAKAVYVQNVLRTRAGTLSGKLRFDIAPGSVVEIEGTSDKFLAAGDQAAQRLVGTVIRVSVAINAEKSKAGTAFRIRDVRTESENRDDRTSSAEHPLYTTIFKGAPLVDDLLMPEGVDCCLA